jgi:serine/threonine-protein kinase RIO1
MYTDSDRFRDTASAFMDSGYIAGEGRIVKRGKEASVLCCPAHPSLGVEYVALKVYKDQEFRNFRNDARRVYDEIVDAIDGMLRCGVIHGDLSAFNILYDGEHPVLIDFPQSVRVTTHDNPYGLFRRDVENVVAHFGRYGLDGADRLADEIWERYYLPGSSG